MAARWTSDEDLLLRRLYRAGVPRREIAARLGRSVDALDARRRSIGVRARFAPKAWSPLEDGLLIAVARAGIPLSELAPRLRRPYESVLRRGRQLGLGRPPARRYDPAEDDALRRGWQEGRGLEALAASLGRSPESLRLRACALGLCAPGGRLRWSAAEDALLRRGYGDGLTYAAIAARSLPGRTAGAVAARAKKLGLTSYARRWSADEQRRLAALAAAGTPLEEAALELVRTPEAIRRRALKLGLEPFEPFRHPNAPRPWQPEEEAVLRQCPGAHPALLARELRRSDHAVRRRMAALGLRLDRERSPHHALPATEGLSPGELQLLARERETGNGRRLLSLARRLGRPPGMLRRAAEALQAGEVGSAAATATLPSASQGSGGTIDAGGQVWAAGGETRTSNPANIL